MIRRPFLLMQRAGCSRLSLVAQPELRVQRLEGRDTGIVLLTMDRPRAKNALGRQLLGELRSAVDSLHDDRTARVVLLNSNVDGVFCAGADLKERAQMTQEETEAFVKNLRDTFSLLGELPQPTIAAVDGAAMGGGLEIAMACDLRVASPSAKFGLVETSLAIIPGAGGTQRLPRIVGVPQAKELIFTGRRFAASYAKEIGLVNAISEKNGEALSAALNLAREVLPNGPIALRAAKKAINEGSELPLEAAMAVERACYDMVIPTKDRLEGLTAFREKRRPLYKGE